MKTWIAFFGGAVLAASIAVIALKKDAEPVQQAAVTAPQEVTPVTPVETQQPSPSAPAAVSTPKPKKAVVSRGFQPPVLESPSQSVTPAQTTTPAPAAAPQEPPPAQPSVPPVQQQEPPAPAAPPKPVEPNRVTVIAGTQISVRLAESLSSDRAQTGQSFQATLDQPIIVDGFVIAERGARLDGRVTESQQAGRVKGVSNITLELTRLTTSDGQRVSIATSPWEKQGEESHKSDATKVAAGAGIGAALGAIFGGGKGAAIGAGSGAGAGTGVVLATRGKPVVLPVETRINFRLRAPVTITEKR